LTGIDWPAAPSHTGLRKCFLKLDGNAIECALRQHATDSTHTAQIAIDGKTLRGSLDRFADRAAVQWISAFATDAKVVLGHVELSGGDKGGEIAAAQELKVRAAHKGTKTGVALFLNALVRWYYFFSNGHLLTDSGWNAFSPGILRLMW
jgi:hypothetical protein